jgi:hypothetical protein
MWHAWDRGEEFTEFWLGGLKVRDHWQDLGVGGSITLSCTLGRLGSMGQTTQLSQVRVQWWALVNTVMNFRVHKESGIFFLIS